MAITTQNATLKDGNAATFLVRGEQNSVDQSWALHHAVEIAGAPVSQLNPFWVSQDDAVTFSGTASAVGNVVYTAPGPTSGVIDTTGFGSVSYQITSIGTANLAVQESNDNATWVSVQTINVASSQNATTQANLSAAGVYRVNVGARYQRLYCSSFTAGPVNVTASLRAFQFASYTTWTQLQMGGSGLSQANALPVYLAVNAAAVTAANTLPAGLYPRASGGLGRQKLLSVSGTNAANLKATPGQIYFIELGNNGASDAWLKFYNETTTPAVGTDYPTWSVYLPKGTARTVNTDIGLAFSTGIGYAITGGAADLDTTAVAANQITGTIGYQ